mmetsp:Transcript_73604/g.168729  ORF Transcript_73604/g.168729 Transcript_73604/m.168729 type:complete len:187 (+) Transcript_73604:110-670(+)
MPGSSGDVAIADTLLGAAANAAQWVWKQCRQCTVPTFVNDGSVGERRPNTVLMDGRTYEGQWLGSERHGRGVERSSNGDFTYEGNFRNDFYHGQGSMRWANGAAYTGQFRNNVKHGYGEEKYAAGEIFRGWFSNGKIEGKGEFISSDGRKVAGVWKEGRLVQEMNLTSLGPDTSAFTSAGSHFAGM